VVKAGIVAGRCQTRNECSFFSNNWWSAIAASAEYFRLQFLIHASAAELRASVKNTDTIIAVSALIIHVLGINKGSVEADIKKLLPQMRNLES
jgi:hypothetical protein